MGNDAATTIRCETQEWVDSLSRVIAARRPGARAVSARQAARRGAAHRARCRRSWRPRRIATRSRRTQEEKSPGNRELEHKIRSAIRWNAVAIILRANKESSELGGHIASFQSSALLYDIGFGHFWHAPTAEHGGDLIYVQGHVSPGIYARAFVEGRLTEQQLLNFRQESDGKGIPSYPHPWLMPDFWQFPTVSMGLGPLMAIYQARFLKYLEGRGLAKTDNRKVWAFLGDGECDEPESLGAISLARPRGARQPDLRHQLQPAAPRRPGARQRQDHPGARRRVPRRRLERDQGRLGLGLGQAVREGQGGHPAQAHGGVRRRPVPGLQEQERRLRARALLQHAGAQGAGRRPVRRRGVEAQSRRPRPVQGLRGVRGGGEAQGPADGDPRQDGEGLRHGRVGRRPDDRAPGEEDDAGCAEAVPRPLRHSDARRQDRRRCRSSRCRRTARR